MAVLITRKDFVYAGVGIWVCLGILLERLIAPTLVLEVVVVSILGIIILGLGMIYVAFKIKKD